MSDEGWPELGWCHHCETFQAFADAPWLVTPYTGPEPVPCCVVCGPTEPWEFGVFSLSGEPEAVPIDGRRGWVRVRSCARKHCERRDSHYPGDCDCETVVRRGLATVVTRCRDCGERVEHRQIARRGNSDDWETDRAFPCDHWRDHQEVVVRVMANKSGRSRSGPVIGNLRSWR